MRLRAEFTTEPFHTDGAPEHALFAREVAERAGVLEDFGPFGTAVSGAAVLAALAEIVGGVFDHGATRISVQLSVQSGADT